LLFLATKKTNITLNIRIVNFTKDVLIETI
jgi:hypothetical protein